MTGGLIIVAVVAVLFAAGLVYAARRRYLAPLVVTAVIVSAVGVMLLAQHSP